MAQDAIRPSVADDGTLVYGTVTGGTGTSSQQLVWVDRLGQVEQTIGQPQFSISVPAISPDGARVAVAAMENSNLDNLDIWIHDAVRGIKTPLTSDPDLDTEPTSFETVTPDIVLTKDEICGPALSVRAVNSDE